MRLLTTFVAAAILTRSAAGRPVSTTIQAHIRAGRFEQAITSITHCEVRHTRSGLALRAQLSMLSGKFKDAAVDLRALGKRADEAMELARLRVHVTKLHRLAKCSVALEGLHTLLSKGRAAVELYLMRGECLLVQQDHLGAHADASRAQALAPHEPGPWLLLGRALYSGSDLGPTDPSARCLARCLRIAPDHRDCAAFRKHLAGVNTSLTEAARFEAAGESQRAIELLQEVLQVSSALATPRLGTEAEHLHRRLCPELWCPAT